CATWDDSLSGHIF
nr:immunoglobulin light chain junction region [Macaca mulatta]MPO06191.1 immunoglobulin light chain junction region [Macaca mulatta]MPO06802.1 immunoglobulin light chain junction region [Macaca mulatta]MPO09050.1 immunoglobulin light chain junction region [Macaca mulatta]MPO10435.1 immunoglobulin light chain junction region [Macaca mulatta]